MNKTVSSPPSQVISFCQFYQLWCEHLIALFRNPATKKKGNYCLIPSLFSSLMVALKDLGGLSGRLTNSQRPLFWHHVFSPDSSWAYDESPPTPHRSELLQETQRETAHGVGRSHFRRGLARRGPLYGQVWVRWTSDPLKADVPDRNYWEH